LINTQHVSDGIRSGRDLDLAYKTAIIAHDANGGLVQRYVERGIELRGHGRFSFPVYPSDIGSDGAQ
jgi:hypothetical protein